MGKRLLTSFVLLFLFSLPAAAQPADSPEAAGITPVTGDLSPWRAYGVDAGNFDTVWIIALNNGNIVAFKRGSEFETPGVIGGSEFLMFGPDGTQLTPAPVPGSFEADGNPTPWADYASMGAAWGAFTLGARPDRANGTGFVVHNQGEVAALFGMSHADEVGDEAFTLVQLFDNDGKPIGANMNAFGTLTGAEGSYRDIGASILSNGDIVALGEDRQSTDDLLDEVGAYASEVAIAVILGRDGTTKVGPFVVHTDEEGFYLGGGSSLVYQNMVAFEGGFVIDYGAGIRWYNNDGTSRTPVQADHAELEGEEVVPGYDFLFGANSGGRGDGMALASNGKDLVVKSTTVSIGQDSVGVLIYYNTDGTVHDWVRFDDTDLDNDYAMVDRTHCDMDENGNVFVVWQDNRFGGAEVGEHAQIFGRFFNSEGEPAGPSFPVYENWREEQEWVDYGPDVGEVPAGDIEQPRCAINSQVAAVIDAATIMPEIPDIVKQLSAAFGMVLNEAVIRIFKSPFAPESVEDWSLF